MLAGFGPLFAAWPGVASPYVLPKLAALALAAAVASRAAAGLPAEDPGRKGPAKPDILLPLGALVLAVGLTTVFSQSPHVSLLGEYSARGQGFLTLTLCAAVAALAQGAGASFARPALFAGAAAGAVLAAYGLLQLAGLDPVLNAVGKMSYGRVGSLTGSPIALGCSLAMILPLQLRSALDGEDALRRRMGRAFLLAGSLGLFFTWSRGAWFAAAASVFSYLLWTGRIKGLKDRRTQAGMAAAVCAAAILAFAAARARPTSASDLGRVAVWQSAWRMFTEHPVLGAGPDAFSLMLGRHKTEGFVRAYGEHGGQANAHNDVLAVLSGAGLAGLAAYAWLVVAAWRRLRAALRDDARRADAAAAGAGLVAAFVVAKFNPISLDNLALGALLLGLIDPGGARSRGLSRSAAAFSSAALLASAWLLAADRRCLQGMRAQAEGRMDEARAAYAGAVRMNPAEQSYGLWLVGAIRERARQEKDPARRLSLSVEAVSAARDLERWNPLDARALHALGGSLASLSLQGGPDLMEEAAAVLERGARADWSYRALLETRLTIANLRRDARAKADTVSRLARLDALARKGG